MKDKDHDEKKFADKRIEAILDERRQLREELMLLQRYLMGLGPVLMTVLGSAFVATLGKDAPAFIQANRGYVLMFLNQLLFFVALYTAMIVLNGQIHNRYIAYLERKLNGLLGERLSQWESLGDAFQPSFAILSAVLVSILSAGFIALAWMTFSVMGKCWLLLLNVAQFLFVAGTFVYQFIWGDKRYDARLEPKAITTTAEQDQSSRSLRSG